MKKIILILMMISIVAFGATPNTVTAKKTPAKTVSKTVKKTNTTAKKAVVKSSTKKKVATKKYVDKRPAYNSFLVGDENGNIVSGENIDTKFPIASVTKVMTFLVTYDAIKSGKVSLDDDVVINWDVAKIGESKIPVKVGEVFKLRDLMTAAAIKSANNAAWAMAIHVGGNVDNFVDMMNAKAKSLGLENELEYHSPAGLPSYQTNRPMDMGTARGLYKLMLEAMKYPEYLELESKTSAKIHDDTITVRSTNTLLGKNGFYGLKTGFHNASGYNILALSEVDNLKAFYVLLGARTSKERADKVLALDKEYRRGHEARSVLIEKKPVTQVTIKSGYKNLVDLYPDKDYYAIVKKESDVKLRVNKIPELEAPIKKGAVYGNYKVLVDGKEVTSGNLVAREDVTKKNLIERIIDTI